MSHWIKDSDIGDIEVSVIMPCLNEEKAVGICIEKCSRAFKENNIVGEIIVVDNGSVDKSKSIIKQSGARLVLEDRKGYGSAYLRGFSEAKGRYLIMGDADDTYDFSELSKFIKPLTEGYDFVIGDRFKGNMAKGKGAMPWLHRYVGNPILSGILRGFFGLKVSDAHCGMRSIKKMAYQKLFLKTLGMEFASEMIINAKRANLKIKEIPINYRLRIGESKLRTFKDGWRHLRFMLLYSPTHLFLVPGLMLTVFGIILLCSLASGPVAIGKIVFDYHYMFMGSVSLIIGYQIINLGFFAKIYSYSEKFIGESEDAIVRFISDRILLEHMILIGTAVFVAGVLLLANVISIWASNNYGELFEVRKMIISLTLMIIGVQTIFFGFFYSILRIEKK